MTSQWEFEVDEDNGGRIRVKLREDGDGTDLCEVSWESVKALFTEETIRAANAAVFQSQCFQAERKRRRVEMLRKELKELEGS